MIFFKNLKLFGCALSVTCCIFAYNVNAEIYTWIDKDKTVNYSDKPTNEEKVIELQPLKKPNLSDPINQNSKWEQDLKKEQQAKKKQAMQKYQDENEKKNYCDNLKSKLAVYQQGGRLYSMSPSGERTYQSSEELTAEKKLLMRKIKDKC